MPTILERLTTKELLDYSRFFVMPRPMYDGDILFPDTKTEYLIAEYERLAEGAELPSIALVHAFDTEAQIGTRPTLEKTSIEKVYIKEKINLSERIGLLMDKGVNSDDALLRYVFGDVDRLMNSVRARSEVAKMEVITTGKMTIKENNLNLTIDYGVPAEQIVTSNWAVAQADILGDIRKWLRIAEEHGVTITDAITSQKIVDFMCSNEAIQKGINGAVNAGVILSLEDVNTLLNKLFGITIHKANKSLYKYTKANGSVGTKRFFNDNVISFYQSFGGAIGNGLWGTTPEELEAGAYTEKNQSQFITAVKWSTPDPVATWTKAAGLMIPVLPNRYALICATVATGE
ncbi:MAG: major capsid protein [Eubacterium sp.]